MSESEDARKKRLAKQLRANLLRRKAQARERSATDAGSPDDAGEDKKESPSEGS